MFGLKRSDKENIDSSAFIITENYLPTKEALALLIANQPTNTAALDLLFLQKYGGFNIDCPTCGFVSFYSRDKAETLHMKDSFMCTHSFCIGVINPLVNTIFYKSMRPLIRWFKALDLLYENPEASGYAVGEVMGVTDAAGWNTKKKLLPLIRNL